MLSEEVEVLQETNRERDNLAKCAKYRKNGAYTSKIRFNKFTDKEINAMHSEITTYPMNAPVPYARFRLWPDEYQRQYILNLREKYHAYNMEIAEVLGIKPPTMAKLVTRLGIPMGKRRLAKSDSNRILWEQFKLLGKQTIDIPEEEEIQDDTPTATMIEEAIAETFAPIIEKAKQAAEPPKFVVSSGEWTFTGDLRAIIEGLPDIFQFRDDYTKTNYRVRIQFMKEEVPVNGV